MGIVTGADATLLLRVLKYAPDTDTRQALRGALTEIAGSDTGWVGISPSEAVVLWEDLVWITHLLPPDEADGLTDLRVKIGDLVDSIGAAAPDD